MKLVYSLILAAVAVFAQSGPQQLVRVTGDCEIYFNFTATGSTAAYDNRVRGCNYWTLYTAPSGYSAINLTIQGAQDNNGVAGTFNNWAADTILLGTHPVTSANASNVQANVYFPWVRVTLNSATGSGRVQGVLLGYRHTFAPVQAIESGTNGISLVSATACTNQTDFSISASGNNQIIAASGATRIRICSISFSATATQIVSITAGTGVNCGTGTDTIAGPYQATQSFVFDFTALTPLILPVGAAMCINQGSAITGGGVVLWAQF